MQAISLNRITQGLHGASKAVDYAALPDSIIYAPEDMTFVSYGQQGAVGTEDDAGLALRMRGASGLHQFAHTSKSLVSGSVKRGQQIAVMGHTGYTIPQGVLGAHCHWWIQTANGYVYPPTLINQTFIKLGEEEPMTAAEQSQFVRGQVFSQVKELTEGVIIMECMLKEGVHVWDLHIGALTGKYPSILRYNKGDKPEAMAYVDMNGTRYYIHPHDLMRGFLYGINVKDINIVGSYHLVAPGKAEAKLPRISAKANEINAIIAEK